MDSRRLEDSIILHEGGPALKPELDPAGDGSQVIGYGRNLQRKGITRVEAYYLLSCDIAELAHAVPAIVSDFWALNDARQNVLLELAYVVGLTGLAGFHNMLSALAIHEYEIAANEILNSKFARQVGQRAITLAHQMRTGEFA